MISYPTLDASYELAKGDYTAGSPIPRTQSYTGTRCRQRRRGRRTIRHRAILSFKSTRQLYVIKKVTATKSLVVKLEFTLPKGTHKPRLYVVCDSYVGADHDIELEPIEVAEGEESDEDDE